MTQNKTDLLPCPFCGSDKLLSGDYFLENKYSYNLYIFCEDCGAKGSDEFCNNIKEDAETFKKVIKKWNNRVRFDTVVTPEQAKMALDEMPEWKRVSEHMSAPTGNFGDWANKHAETIRKLLTAAMER